MEAEQATESRRGLRRYSAEDRKRGMELGAEEYIVKPFTAGELREAVERVLKKGS